MVQNLGVIKMNFQTHTYSHGYLRYLVLEGGSWYHAQDACDLSGVVDSKAAINAVADDDVLILNGFTLVNICGFETLSRIGQRDRDALTLIWLTPQANEAEVV